MFANTEFIAATRDFVCIRIETYENSAAEKRVRSLLGGRYANTAFCVFDHTGTKQLSASGRSPSSLVRRGAANTVAITAALQKLAKRHGRSGELAEPALLADASNFKQALNVAAGDQRLLFVVNGVSDAARLRARQAVAAQELVGRFHVDVLTKGDAPAITKVLGRDSASPGFLIVRAGQFGLEGEIMQRLSESVSTKDIQKALLACNETFAADETRKVYDEHVQAGLKKGINVEFDIPKGEDRDGDGTRDREQRRRRGRRRR